jgi:hypothetical protein
LVKANVLGESTAIVELMGEAEGLKVGKDCPVVPPLDDKGKDGGSGMLFVDTRQ